jgi:hypothetical protein
MLTHFYLLLIIIEVIIDSLIEDCSGRICLGFSAVLLFEVSLRLILERSPGYLNS